MILIFADVECDRVSAPWQFVAVEIISHCAAWPLLGAGRSFFTYTEVQRVGSHGATPDHSGLTV